MIYCDCNVLIGNIALDVVYHSFLCIECLVDRMYDMFWHLEVDCHLITT